MKKNDFLHEAKAIAQIERSIIDLLKKYTIRVNGLIDSQYRQKYTRRKKK